MDQIFLHPDLLGVGQTGKIWRQGIVGMGAAEGGKLLDSRLAVTLEY